MRWRTEMEAILETNGETYKYTLAIDKRFNHPPAKVWRALVERDLLTQWFPCDIAGEWKPGAKLDFIIAPEQMDNATEDDLHGEVIAVDEPSLLEFRWGTHAMRFELRPDGDGCHFTLSEFFDEKAWCARNAAGWEMCIENLDLILDGVSALEFVAEVWRDKFDRYAEKFKNVTGPRGGLAEDDPLLKLGRE